MVTHDRYFLSASWAAWRRWRTAACSPTRATTTSIWAQGRPAGERAASERKRQAILRREYQWVMQGPTARGPRAGSGWSAMRP